MGFNAPMVATTTSAAAAASLATKPHLEEEYYRRASVSPSAGRKYFPTLTPPFWNRATYRYDLGRGAWAFEQLLTFANVTATIRCTVLELQRDADDNGIGGLWVHSPQWPTGEFVELLEELGRPVRHIVLPCNALEHKAPMQSFCKRYPEATVWISPGQYGLFGSCGVTMKDVNKPLSMPYRVDGILGDYHSKQPPWATEFDMAALYVNLPQNAGPVSEVAFLHRPTKTLVATDAVVYIPLGPSPPDIFNTYFDPVKPGNNDPYFWQKSVLQAVFLPLRVEDDSGGGPNFYPGFEALKERLVRAPILRAFADARAPNDVRNWVNKISKWDFDRILTSHFASPISASARDFAAAFSYLEQQELDERLPPIACRDWELLDGLNKAIEENNLGAPVLFDYAQGCL